MELVEGVPLGTGFSSARGNTPRVDLAWVWCGTGRDVTVIQNIPYQYYSLLFHVFVMHTY